MDPKLKLVLAAAAGALGGVLLLGSAFAIPAVIHAVAGSAVTDQAYGPGMMRGQQGGMMGQQDGAEWGNQRGGQPGMMGPRGGMMGQQGGRGYQDGSDVCPNGTDTGTCPSGADPSTCPNSGDATGTSL